MKRPKVKLSNRKVIFYNTTRDAWCICCHADLKESYLLSAPNNRYRCLGCALHHNIITEIPHDIQIAITEEGMEILA